VRPPLAPPDPSSDALAEVIPLDVARRQHPSAADADGHAGPPTTASQSSAGAGDGRNVDPVEVARALGVLRRRAGDRGLELPTDLGRALADLEHLLVEGPTQVDAGRVLPALAAEVAALARAAAAVTLEMLPEEIDVLGQALAADLAGLRLDALHEVADAVLAVSRAPRAAAHWGEPRAAEAAEAVITAAASDLREAASTHEWLYEHFTDRVWTIPTPLLERGQRRWRVAARARLTSELRRASRTGRVPSRLHDTAAGVLLARRARARVDGVAPLLAQHLGGLNRGPLSDADDALRAVRAVRRLQAALGDLADGERLRRLLLADAFRSEDVFGPAVNVRMALGAWQRDLDGVGGRDAWAFTLDELVDWTEGVTELLPALRQATDAAAEVGARVSGLRDLVHLLLLRQHVAELTDAQAAERAAELAAAEAAEAAERHGATSRASGGTAEAVATAEALLAAMRGMGDET